MGVEASASHINEMENPKRNYPLCMIMLVILAIVLNTVGGLTVAASIPPKDLSLSSGVVQAVKLLMLHFDKGLGWAVKAVALMLSLGVIGEIASWVVGPSRGIYASAQKGLLPKKFREVNKHDVPVFLIMIQGIIVTIWAAVLTFGGGAGNLSFLIAISLTVVIYLAGYLLLFAAYLKLARHKEIERTYHVPGKTAGKYIFAVIGLIVSLFALIISFVPPSSIAKGQGGTYLVILIISFAVTLVIPFIVYEVYGKKNSDPDYKHTHLKHHEQNKFTHLWARGEHAIDSKEEDRR
jgi:amino acid transporter